MTRQFLTTAVAMLATTCLFGTAMAQDTLQLQVAPPAGQQQTLQQGEPRLLVQPELNPGYVNPAPTLGIQAVMNYGWVEVTGTVLRSPASRLGLEPGDRILEINGRKIHGLDCMTAALRDAAEFNNGQIQVLIDNVRARRGEYGAQRYVTGHTYLNGYPDLSKPTCPQTNPPSCGTVVY